MTSDEQPAKSPKVHVERTTATYRLVVAYHGGKFCGFQAQEGGRSVQDTLNAAIEKVTGEPASVRCAGRTDSGVHARGQVVSVRFSSRIPEHKMILALNSQLDDDIAIVRADRMFDDFDARRHGVAKCYVYRVHTALSHDPFVGSTSWHVRQKLDVVSMQQASAHFVGEKDFEAFRSQHCDALHARRYIWRADLRQTGALLELEIRGNAFCRHMVRCIAGTLVDVGRGRFRPDDIPLMFESRDRTKAGITAPANGLTLEEVYYPDRIMHAEIPKSAQFPHWPPTRESWPGEFEEGLLQSLT